MVSISNNTFADDALLKARVEDAVRLCKRRSAPLFVGFLDERQRTIVKGMISSADDVNVTFWGGHDEGERVLLGVAPSYLPLENEWFPLTAMAFHFRAGRSITHRDVLGSLLASGVKRDMIGDILCADGLAVVFAKDEIIAYLQSEVVKIGGEGVRCDVPYVGTLPQAHTFVPRRDTVASPRLDAVLHVCLAVSREDAAKRIESGLVLLNHTPCESVSAEVHEHDVISVRGAGRFRVAQIGPPTKKGRLFVTVEQYT